MIIDATTELYDRIINPDLLVRRITVAANRVVPEGETDTSSISEQLSFFDIFDEDDEEVQSEKRAEEKEKRVQKTLIEIKNKYGKNAIVKGMNLEEGATAMERNKQVGGHKA